MCCGASLLHQETTVNGHVQGRIISAVPKWAVPGPPLVHCRHRTLIAHSPFSGCLPQHERKRDTAALSVVSAIIKYPINCVDEDGPSDRFITLVLFHARVQEQEPGAAILHVLGVRKPQKGAAKSTNVVACSVVTNTIITMGAPKHALRAIPHDHAITVLGWHFVVSNPSMKKRAKYRSGDSWRVFVPKKDGRGGSFLQLYTLVMAYELEFC